QRTTRHGEQAFCGEHDDLFFQRYLVADAPPGFSQVPALLYFRTTESAALHKQRTVRGQVWWRHFHSERRFHLLPCGSGVARQIVAGKDASHPAARGGKDTQCVARLRRDPDDASVFGRLSFGPLLRLEIIE